MGGSAPQDAGKFTGFAKVGVEGSVSVFDSRPDDALIDYGAGVSSKALPSGFSTANMLDREAASKESDNTGFHIDLRPGQPSVDLRLVTIDSGIVNPAVPDAICLDYVDRPSWVLVWQGSRIAVRGGFRDDAVRKRLAESSECVFVIVVDAMTGQSVSAHQFCRDSRRPQA